jgi:hypothetical protein
MGPLECFSIAVAVAVLAVRVLMFFPRSAKADTAAEA